MSIWSDHRVEERVVAVLQAVPEGVPGHHFGRPFLTAYQVAIAVDRAHPEIRQALGYVLGGEGAGSQVTFAQYLARELSRRINDDPAFPVEGRMLSNVDVMAIDFRGPTGERLRSSLTGSGYDLSMFRIHETAGPAV